MQKSSRQCEYLRRVHRLACSAADSNNCPVSMRTGTSPQQKAMSRCRMTIHGAPVGANTKRRNARIMESPALPLHRPCYRPISPANPREEGCKHQKQDPELSHRACSGGLKAHLPATSRIPRHQPPVGDCYCPAAALRRRAACCVCGGGLVRIPACRCPRRPGSSSALATRFWRRCVDR